MISTLFDRRQGMEDNRVGFGGDGAQPGPVPLIGRELPVYTIDDGPEPTQLWKRLCVLLLCFVLFLIFMLVIKSFHC